MAAITSIRRARKEASTVIEPPKVNPAKIVLEMDLIDKSKLDEEKNQDVTSIANLSN